MIFEPNFSELNIINHIHKFNDSEYTLIRLTETMIKKNNIDANALLRDILINNGLVNYNNLNHGGKNGKKFNVDLLLRDSYENIIMNFYKVAGNRGDPRFSIYNINTLFLTKKINIGDLLYFTVIKIDNSIKIIIINLTSNVPSDLVLLKVFGIGRIEDAASRLIPKVREIASKGFHPNSKGSGKASNKDVGDTLEYLLGIKTNNSQAADFEGTIEIKAKVGKTLDTLFTLRPMFEGTSVEQIESFDRSRVSAFTRLYGYDSDAHLGYKSLYVTIGTKIAPQNKVGLFLEVNESDRIVELRKWTNTKKHELVAYWTFDSLKTELHLKHPATLWVKAVQRTINNITDFNYFEAELSKEPQFTTFLSLIGNGVITYDWRGYTTTHGKYQGKNHGNAWRIKNKYRELLFDSVDKIDLK